MGENRIKEMPEVEDILDLAMSIIREFARFANDYYNEHQDNEVLKQINASYDLYEVFFRETLADVLLIAKPDRMFTKSAVSPFSRGVRKYLTEKRVLKYCRANRAVIIQAVERLIEKTILQTMFNVGGTDGSK